MPPNRETLQLLLEARGAAGDLFGVRAALDAMVAAGWAPGSAAWAAAMWYSGVAGDLQVCGGFWHSFTSLTRGESS